MTKAIASNPDKSFSDVAYKLLNEVASTRKDIDLRQLCLRELDAALKTLSSSYRVRPFGSAANGFCTRFSDLDVTCYEEIPSGKSASNAIVGIQPLLHQHESFKVIEVISGARIPILKLRFKDKLDVDLSFQNIEPLPNTQLLRAYAKLSTTIRHLGILVKLWANAEGVCGAQHGHLSSYSLILMVLYFLQVDEHVKMPCFLTWEFTGEKNLPECAKVSWSCPLEVHLLLPRFFEFYATAHWWGYEVVSPRVGKRLYANDNCFANLNGRDNSAMILIEDPFLLARNLNCVLGPMQQGLLYSKFRQAHADLESGRVPDGFTVALQKYCTENAIIAQKFAMQSDSQESTQSGASATSLPSSVEPDARSDGDRDIATRPLLTREMYDVSLSAPSPAELPSLRFSVFSAPVVSAANSSLDDTTDTEIADGTTWSL